MGTNFYWLDKHSDNCDEDDPEIHIGKSSAAGAYCWDCGVTLCVQGNDGIHYDSDWHSKCPKCNQIRGKDTTAAKIELGFTEPRSERPSGVQSCSSFTWAQYPSKVKEICQDSLGIEIIINEYGDKLTGQQFLDMLEYNCPVQFRHMIKKYFS